MNAMPRIAPLGDYADHEPTENSSLDELAAYALEKQRQIIARDTKNGEDLWLMGQALEWAKKKFQYGVWEDWFKSQGLKKTWVWQARTLHKNASLDDVKELGMTEALRKFKVLPEKKPQAGIKAVGGKKKEDEEAEGVAASDQQAEEPSETSEPSEDSEKPTEASEPPEQDGGHEQDEADDQPSDDLAAEEDNELKAYQESIRTLAPKARAVIIHHALELLRDELDGEEVDEELQQTFGQIAQLAEELKGLNNHDE